VRGKKTKEEEEQKDLFYVSVVDASANRLFFSFCYMLMVPCVATHGR
jgi:hypothetical protein